MKKLGLIIFINVILFSLTACYNIENMCDIVGHYYKDIVISPTCEKEGYTLHQCRDCSNSYIDSEIKALGHNIIEVEEVFPTCNNEGNSAGTKCSRCNDKNDYIIYPALGHDMITDSKVEPTCTTTGLTEGGHCSRCDYVIAQEVIEKLEHNYSSAVTQPTCESEGYITHTCNRCDDEYVDSYVDALGHDMIIDEKVEPTCTTTGLTEGSHCSRCNYEIAQEVIPALGHEYSDWVIVINPSCNSEGKDEKACIKCGNIIERDTRITGIDNKVLVSNPVDQEYFVGKTLLTIGDSITCGVGLNDKTNEYYGKLVADALGMNVINKGISGSVYCYGGSATTNNTLNASNIKNADVITIFLGINDFNHACKNGHAYGNPNYTSSDRTYYQVGEYGTTDTSTLYGALKVWCENIEQLKSIEGYEDKQFVIITPLISSWNASIGPRSWDQGKTNIHGHTLREYCTAIMRVYAEYGIPVFDANMLSGIYYNSSSDNNAVATGGDGVHINAEGHKILANSLIEFLLEGYSYEYRENNSNAHQYNKTIVDPTCTLDGYTKHICSICYDVYNTDFVNALGHEIIIDEKVEPTCENTGLTKGEHCTKCDYKVAQEVIPVLGHNVVIDEEVEPTCVNTGLTEGSHCSTCNKVFEEQISIPIVEHNYVNGVCISCNKEKMPYQRLTYFNVYVEINDKQYKDNAVLYLPANYTPTGEPSKLIIFCKQGISKITSNSNPIEQVGFYNYLLTLGYAILGVDGVPDEWKNEIGICERVVGNPYAAKATETAYHYVIDNYNLDDKGCFISGYSQGGHYAQNVIDLTDIPILAAAEQSPVCSMRYHQWDLTENVTINGVKFTKGARINLARIYGFSEVKTNSDLLNLKYDENLLSEYDPWIRNTTNVYNGFVQKSNLWYLPTNFDLNSLTMTKEVKCPIKIWCSEDDGEISADVMKVFVKAIQNAGGHAEISIAQKGGHGYFKKQTPVGYFYENGKKYNTLPIAVETAEWFAKFGGYTCKHSYSETIVEPTCVEQGYTNYTCITCGHTYKDNYVDSIDHKLIDTIIDSTCTSEGYTLHECEECDYCFMDSYKALEEHSYQSGYCIDCNIAHPNLENFDGKVISIFGDSISTFAGYIPVADGFNLEHLARYPQDNLLTDVNDTWWMQIINTFDAKLGINDSWRGATVSGDKPVTTGTSGENASFANLVRIKNLGANGKPDVILFYGGTNDLAHVSKVGTFDVNSAPTIVDLETIKWDNLADAYVQTLLRLKYYYPDTQIICLLPTYTSSYYSNTKLANANEILTNICEFYEVPYVDLRYCGISVNDLPDGIHPNANGMNYITNATIKCLLENCTLDIGENVVYSVKHNLMNGDAELHYYKGVSKDTSFKEYVDGYDVTVLMNGVDITDECYKDGYINIETVTGDIEITVIDEFDADGHLQELPQEICSGTNIWNILEHENIYYTINGWGITASTSEVHSITFQVAPGDRIWATSFQKCPQNGNQSSSTNAIRIAWFDELGNAISISPNDVYTEFENFGYIIVPDGITTVSIPMWNNNDDNEVYILNKDHVYENGLCKCCNMVNPDLNSLNGKTVSILGDSISTYIGVSDDSSVNSTLKGGNIYYTEGRWGVYRKDTWWQQVIDALGMKLLVNNSWSGSCVLHTRNNAPGAYINRCCQLHNEFTNEEPDIILIFISANDFSYFQNKLGDSNIDYSNLIIKNNDGSYSYKTPTTSCEAYAIMLHKITNRYQNAKVYCLTSLVRRYPDYNDNYADVGQPTEFNKNLINIAKNLNCEVIDLEKCGINKEADIFDKYIADKRTHPNPLGMDEISKAVCSALINSDVNIFKVDYKVSNVTLESNVNSAIINNSYHNKIILPESNTLSNVLVTMNGIDITSSAYNNNEINISKVTGDIFIEIIANRPFLNFAWTLENNNLISTGEALNTVTQIAGSIDDGVINNGQFSLENNIVLKHEVNWVIEFTFAYDWRGVIFSNNSNPRTHGMLYLTRTNGGNLCFGTYDGSSYQNYGVTLSILDNDPHKFSLVNEVSNEGNMIYLYIDGEKIGAMDNYFIGSTSQNITSNWVNGKDFIFSFIGMDNHALRDCKFESLYVYENANII